jgi:hypothetical protein
LPIGVGLLYAAYNPSKYFPLLVLGFWASAIHALNHLYDDVVLERSLSHFLSDGLSVTVAALALGWAYLRVIKER